MRTRLVHLIVVQNLMGTGAAWAVTCPPPVPNAGPPVVTTGAPTISGEYSWIVDRYPTDVFEQIAGDTLGKSGAIHMMLGPCGYYDRDGGREDNSQFYAFYDLQGRKAAAGIVPGTAVVSSELYLPEEWDATNTYVTATGPGSDSNRVGDFQEPTLLMTVNDGNGDAAIYPAIRFVNRSNSAEPARVQIYDSLYTSQWITVEADVEYGAWNTIEVLFTKDDNDEYILDYRLNGASIYIDHVQDGLGATANDPGLRLVEMMLQGANNNNSPYDIYWANTYAANLRADGDPLAGAVTGDLVLVGGAGALDGAEVDGNLALSGGAATSGDGTFTGDGLVKTGAALGGNLGIDGNLSNLSGIISPGNSPGIITIGGNYVGSLAGPDDTIPSGVFEVDTSATSSVAGVDYDQFNIGGWLQG